MNKTIFQGTEQSAEVKKIELTARAMQQRKDNKGLYKSEHTLMGESLQKKYVREVVGV
jgi:hypothetical protein